MKKDIILSTKPFSDLGFSIASAASILSFIAPIVKILL